MSITPYPELNAVLGELVRRLRDVLEENLVSVVLQGSFAVGDFDENSDVDFIVVTKAELSNDQVDRLQRLHEQIYDVPCPWAQHLEGSYFPRDVLADYTRRGEPLWYLDHGSRNLIQSDHCNTIVVRRVVREHGVLLFGDAPVTLVEPIPVEVFQAEILQTMRTWGVDILSRPEPYNNRFYQAFIVLSYCRMLRDLRNGQPGSKRAGAEWAKIMLDPIWIDLIDRTWLGRPDPAKSVREPADPTDFARTLEFVTYVNNLAAK